MDLTEFLSEFQLEAGEKLDVIASQLLRLERDTSDPQPVREMFLAAHTIKGGAAMMRLTEVEALAHAIEDLLGSIRDQHRPLDGAAVDLLFQAIDQLRALVTEASSTSVGAEPDAALLALAARLRAPASSSPVASTPRALLVEESATVRELEQMLLEDAGYQVDVCDDAQAAASRAVSERFDLVVVGLQKGALKVCAAVRSANVAVVVTSTDANADLARQVVAAGAKALVRKGSLRDAELAAVLKR